MKLKGIFFDLDETLIHSSFHNNKKRGLLFNEKILPFDSRLGRYVVEKRPIADKLIKIAHEKFGQDNVHMLTAATRDYAFEVIDLWGFPFKRGSVLAREDMSEWREDRVARFHKENLLIDNQKPLEYNAEEKMKFLGIDSTRLFSISEFTGALHSRMEKALEKCELIRWEKFLIGLKAQNNA